MLFSRKFPGFSHHIMLIYAGDMKAVAILPFSCSFPAMCSLYRMNIKVPVTADQIPAVGTGFAVPGFSLSTDKGCIMIKSIATWFNAGGPYMWVILGVCAVAFAVAADRFIYYFILCGTDSSRLLHRISGLLSGTAQTGIDRFSFIKKRRTPLYTLLKTAIDRFEAGAPIEQIQEGVEEASIKELPKITRRISYLALFANIATLVGLLGTIAGLQQSFGSLASAEAAQKAAMLAAGIAQAMNTTAFGLIVAVPCMVLFTILNNKQQSIINDIDDAVVRVVNTMKTVRV